MGIKKIMTTGASNLKSFINVVSAGAQSYANYSSLPRTGVTTGDWAETADAGEAWRAYLDATVSRPVWVPAHLYGQIVGYLSHTAGKKSAILLADANVTAVTDRGWITSNTSGAGTVTKTGAGSPLILNSGAAHPGRAEIDFWTSGYTGPNIQLAVAEVKVTAGTQADGIRGYTGGEARHGTIDFCSSATLGKTIFAVGGNGTIDLSTKKWIWWVYNETSATSLNIVQEIPYPDEVSGRIFDDRNSGTSPYASGWRPEFQADYTSGEEHELEIYECHFLELSDGS